MKRPKGTKRPSLSKLPIRRTPAQYDLGKVSSTQMTRMVHNFRDGTLRAGAMQNCHTGCNDHQGGHRKSNPWTEPRPMLWYCYVSRNRVRQPYCYLSSEQRRQQSANNKQRENRKSTRRSIPVTCADRWWCGGFFRAIPSSTAVLVQLRGW